MAVLAMAMVMAACSGDDGGGDDGGADVSSDATEQGGDAGSGGTCDDGDPLLIGAVLDITGAVAEVSQQQQEGMEIAVEEINAGDGVLGRCVELVVQDSQNDPTQAATVTRELIDRDEVDVLVGPVNSGPQGASIEVSRETDTLHVVGALAPIDYEEFPFVFRNEFASQQVGPGFVSFAEELGADAIGILASNDAFGTSIADAVQATAEETGAEITAVEFFDPQSVDLLPQVRAVRDSGAEVVVSVITGQAGISALSARQELGWDAPVLGFSGIATPEIIEGVGEEAMDGVYVTLNYDNLVRSEGESQPSDEAVQAFIETLKEFRGEDPLTLNVQWPAGGYDMVMMLADAIEGAGDVDAEAVRQQLYDNGYDALKADYEAEPGDHDLIPDDALAFVVAGTLEDGTLERVETE
ncbi:ABC transporter substrate-binding protein [Euzebya sp.]|uniref:ABC transporter substrate-binding protein n=1 Tax=Euzebya sp. TaxID=1971409 RepID=UPI003512D764